MSSMISRRKGEASCPSWGVATPPERRAGAALDEMPAGGRSRRGASVGAFGRVPECGSLSGARRRWSPAPRRGPPRAAAANRSPRCGHSGAGLAAARTVRRARATPPFLLVGLAAADGDEDPPSPSARRRRRSSGGRWPARRARKHAAATAVEAVAGARPWSWSLARGRRRAVDRSLYRETHGDH